MHGCEFVGYSVVFVLYHIIRIHFDVASVFEKRLPAIFRLL